MKREIMLVKAGSKSSTGTYFKDATPEMLHSPAYDRLVIVNGTVVKRIKQDIHGGVPDGNNLEK